MKEHMQEEQKMNNGMIDSIWNPSMLIDNMALNGFKSPKFQF